MVRAVADAGADAIEIGIPFSDPVMDGRIIQEASRRALEHRRHPRRASSPTLAKVDVGIPLAVMTYFNPVAAHGAERFAALARGPGIDGAIVPDLPLDELGDWGDAADAAGVETVLLAAPTTPDERLVRICARSRGFVYGVSLMGVTGRAGHPVGTGPGDGPAAQGRDRPPRPAGCWHLHPGARRGAAASASDGVIVGSALVRRLLEGGGPEQAGNFTAEIRAALDGS